MLDYPPVVQRLIGALKQLPSIGPRSAERLALHILNQDKQLAVSLHEAIREAREKVRPCRECGFIADQELCEICRSSNRQEGVLCVVEQATDVLIFERSGAYHGHYHVLGGCLSPLDNIGPEELQIPQLLNRIKKRKIKELVIGLNADVKGETTSIYLAREAKALGVKVTRLATGISVGGALEFADSVTLSHALNDRKEI